MSQTPGRNRLPVILMAASLVLLLVFELFWLKSEYDDQKDWLSHEQSTFFYSAIRSLEDSLFNEMVLQPLQIRVDSFEFLDPSGKKLRFQKEADTATYVTVVRSIDIQRRKRDYRSRLNRGLRSHRSILLGALSMHLGDERDSLSVASLDSLVLQALKNESKTPLPLPYEVVSWERHDSIQTAGLISAPYVDYWSDRNFAIVYPNYRGLLISKLWRQILFALLLFSCTSVAFGVIYNGLRKQRRMSRLRSDFINNITHELKTPIATVRVALEAITNFSGKKDPRKEKEYMEIAQSELNRLTLLVDKVLQMSQLDDGAADFKIELFDLRDLINQILNTMKVQFDRLTADVHFNASGDTFTIEGDRMHMTGVVYNLLDNAMKYRSQDPEIDVSLVQDNGSLVLEVSDNGQGIPGEYVDKIFEKFFRVPTGDRHDTKGHGLGLSYVAEVVHSHNGSISVDSVPGKGSKFKLTFPRAHVN